MKKTNSKGIKMIHIQEGQLLLKTTEDWYFFISAYGWLAGIDGIIADGGIDEDMSIEGLLAGRSSGESQESFKKWLAKRLEKAP